MCVIIHSLRKKHLKREEVMAAMRQNNSGFFMSHWEPSSSEASGRTSIRTLNEDEALEFFDKTPDDDVFVMHARIPSRGTVSVDNVHGWEEDGIAFCHNMTMSSLSGVMTAEKWSGTDSEYFFRKLFIPMHRGEHLANPELKPGEMGPATKRLVTLLCGDSNKFLFIMPDNTVLRAGTWSTIATDKRTITEEREIDEVVGETVDVNGKVTKKTEKVKRTIQVDREFATVLASNTYYRTLINTTANTLHGISRSWDTKTGTYRSASVGSEKSGAYDGYGYGYDCGYGYGYGRNGYYDCQGYDYDADYDDECGLDATNKAVKALVPVKQSAANLANAKIKKTAKSADDDDYSKFTEWRASLNKSIETPMSNDVLSSLEAFGDAEITDGKFTQESFVNIFNTMLRCLIYNNIRVNLDKILAMDNELSLLPDASFSEISIESEDLIATITPDGFDSSLTCVIFDKLVKFYESVSRKFDVSGNESFMLPSEKLQALMEDIALEIDSAVSQLPICSQVQQPDDTCYGVEENPAALFRSRLTAIDRMLNISFGQNVKTNKDIGRYVRAAVIVERKLRWIPTPLLLAHSPTVVTSSGNFVKSKDVESFVSALNFIVEACVSNGKSVERADRRYIGEISGMGFDFDKKGSTEIFTGTANALASANAENPGLEEEHEPRVLGDLEKIEGGKA